MKIQAAVFRAPKAPLTIEEIEIDDPAPHEVLVRTVASGVCHSDLHYVHGLLPLKPPAILGHEPAGIVEGVGRDVTSVAPGDHVIACTSLYCGNCAQCIAGRPHLCADRAACQRAPGARPRLSQNGAPLHQFVDLAAFAEKMLLHERAVLKVENDIPLECGALLGCAVTTGVGAALNTAQVAPGSTVAVFGAGGVGLSVIQGARIAGARRIIAVDLLYNKLAMARHFGATDTVNASAGDAVREIKRISQGGVDYSFEAIGNRQVAEQCFYCLAPRGTATLVGAIPTGQKIELNAGHFFVEKRIQGCYMGSNRFRLDMPKYLDFYRQGRLNLDDMVSRRAPLNDVNEAFRAMEAGEVARTVLMFN
ncbi:MAG TPA: Zn-dependent alcohol dehydrogenase [Candidatus Binataceae bacterium]|nr:Zn-dependent alcohol dehydrogenase [Candidatus Binataceae bacterium]